MANLVRILAVVVGVTLFSSGVAMAQTPAAAPTGAAVVAAPGDSKGPLYPIGRGVAAIGAGIVALGGGLGIGKLAGSALEAMGRQPEAAATIQVAMLIAAALIEGFVFFGIYVCWYT